jgi:hypothetical protein
MTTMQLNNLNQLTRLICMMLFIMNIACSGSFNVMLKEGSVFKENATMTGMKVSVVSRGNFPLGTLQTRDPVYYDSTDDIFCPVDKAVQQRPDNASLINIYFVEQVSNCSHWPSPSFMSNWGNPNMTFIVVRAPPGTIEEITNIIAESYNWDLLTFSRRNNAGFIILDSVSFDTLKNAYIQENTSFQTIMDFRVVIFHLN